MKATEQYFPEVLCITPYKVVLTLESENKMPQSYHLNESSLQVLSHGIAFFSILLNEILDFCTIILVTI